MCKPIPGVRYGGRCLLLVVWIVPAASAEELYAPPTASEVRSQCLAWVAEQSVMDNQLLEQVGKLWAFGDEHRSVDELLESVIKTFSLLDPNAQALVEACHVQDSPFVASEALASIQDATNDFYRANLQLYYARHLTQRRMYEEALELFTQIDCQQVVDIAGCLFFRCVCEHSLLRKDDGLKTVQKLLKNTQNVPVRYSTVAKLMEYDFQSMKDKSLDEVSRKMSDVERRLTLGRGGERVQKVEQEIIATLDEIIKKIEQQQGGGGGGANPGGRQNQSSSPAQDSVVKGTTAPGEVDKKNIGNEAGWGSMPPKAATEAKNLINRQFPAHYRQAIEQYFKKSANRPALRKD